MTTSRTTRKSRLVISTPASSNAYVLPSTVGCILGPEAEACANGRTTMTLEEYRRGSVPA